MYLNQKRVNNHSHKDSNTQRTPPQNNICMCFRFFPEISIFKIFFPKKLGCQLNVRPIFSFSLVDPCLTRAVLSFSLPVRTTDYSWAWPWSVAHCDFWAPLFCISFYLFWSLNAVLMAVHYRKALISINFILSWGFIWMNYGSSLGLSLIHIWRCRRRG